MKKICSCIFFCAFFCGTAFAQQILTAGSFFQSVSENYGGLRDYEATIKITAAKNDMEGRISFKRPNLLRIDFTRPDEQVIVFNGDVLTIYLVELNAVLNQYVSSSGGGVSGANLATPQGLSLMSRYYTIAYKTGQDPVPLEPDSEEMVVQLLLSRKNTSEGFRTLTLSVDPDTRLIRRIEGTTVTNDVFLFDFTNYALNQGIPDTRFIYDAPSSANNYNNFLFAE
ncbi:MAG: outer-membrane lipoprotein carrier protein LolA [Spirochaetaceae bacterium]|jgi:outer membrane lipoprotein-sorting protein|nr:outer-membrane lipoprotein carrier protein LolA [Spirochaetaceae bacterium]